MVLTESITDVFDFQNQENDKLYQLFFMIPDLTSQR